MPVTMNRSEIRRVSKSVFAVHGLTPIEEFNDYFDAEFSDEEVDTVGGLVMHAFGHLPKKGEAVTLSGFTFKVVHADRRRLLQTAGEDPPDPRSRWRRQRRLRAPTEHSRQSLGTGVFS